MMFPANSRYVLADSRLPFSFGHNNAYNDDMGNIKVVSFDLEGTLVTPDFSEAVWHHGIPSLYATTKGISFEEARAIVKKEYLDVGDQRTEWYDIKYWFRRFQLRGYKEVLEQHRDRVSIYPDAKEVLSSLGKGYTLIVTSSSSREFLPHLLAQLDGYFTRAFSSISDYGQLKTSAFYLTLCRQMNILPSEMVHVGDSWQFDLLAASEAGIKAFHLDREPDACRENSLKSLMELPARLQGTQGTP